jgi:PAS domain S-box-containing protein
MIANPTRIRESKNLQVKGRKKNSFADFPDTLLRFTREGILIETKAMLAPGIEPKQNSCYRKTLDDLLPEEAVAAFRRALKKLGRSESPLVFDYATGHTGNRKHYRARLLPLDGDQVLALVSNISEQKKLEEAYHEIAKKYLKIAQKINDGLVIIQDGLIKFANLPLAKITGIKISEAINKSFTDFVAPAYKELVFDQYMKIMSGQKQKGKYEIEIIKKNGTHLPIEVHSSLILHDGKPADMAIIREIGERKKWEKILFESQQRLSLIAANTDDVIFAYDMNHKLIYINSAFEKLTGYRIDALYEGNLEIQFHPDDAERVKGFWQTLFAGKANLEEEFRIITKDGRVKCILCAFGPLCNDAGQQIGVRGSARDVTARKQAEEAHARENTLLNALMDTIPDNIYFKDINSRFIKINRSMVSHFDLREPSEAVGKSDFDFFSNEHASQAFSDEQEVIRSGQALVNKEERETWPNGQETWASTTKVPLRDKDGNIIGTFGISRNITAQKQAEKALQESDERYHRLAENAHDMIFRLSLPDGRYTYVNPASNALTGYLPEEFYKIRGIFWQSLHPDFQDYFKKQWREIVRGEMPPFYEYQIINKSGEIKWLHQRNTMVYNEHRQPIAIEAIATDITDRKKAEDALKEEHNLLRTLIDSIPDQVYIKDSESKFTICNNEVAKRFGCKPEQIIGKTDFDFFSKELAARYYAEEQEIVRTGHPLINHEEPSQDKDGNERWNLSTKVPLRSYDGKIVGLVGINHDITRRKQIVETLQYDEARERILLEINQMTAQSLEEIIRYALEASVSLCKSKFGFFAFIGEQESAVIKQYWSKGAADHRELLDKRDMMPMLTDSFFSEAVRQHKPVTINNYSVHHLFKQSAAKNGLTLTRLINVPIFEGVRIVAILGLANKESDYTKSDAREMTLLAEGLWNIIRRKQAEEKLKDSEASLRTIFNNLYDAIIVLDKAGKILDVNDKMLWLFGISREEALGLSIIYDLSSDTNSTDRFRQIWLKNPEQQNDFFEWKAKRPCDGSEFDVEVFAGSMNLLGTEVLVATVHDISDRKRTEAEKRSMEIQLRHAQKMESVGQLAAGIAHEINTPTQFVGDNTQFLLGAFHDLQKLQHISNDLLNECKKASFATPIVTTMEKTISEIDSEFLEQEIPKAIEQSLDGIQRIAKIVRAMKEFSHPDQDEKVLSDINKAIETTVTVARNEWKYVAEIKMELDPSLPPVLCFPGDLNQVILNLIINAAHAIAEKIGKSSKEKGMITIQTIQAKSFIEIRVHDNGTGIPEEHRQKIFEPFFTTKPVGKGTGQGLAICYNVIVTKHGGKLTFETKMGEGTAFVIHLPIKNKIASEIQA